MIIVIIDIQLSFRTTYKLPHFCHMTNVVIFSTEIECKLAGIQQAAAGRCLVFAGTLILPERCFHFAWTLFPFCLNAVFIFVSLRLSVNLLGSFRESLLESIFSIFGVLWSCGTTVGGLDLKVARQLDVILRAGVFAYYSRFTIFLIYNIVSYGNISCIFSYSSRTWLFIAYLWIATHGSLRWLFEKAVTWWGIQVV